MLCLQTPNASAEWLEESKIVRQVRYMIAFMNFAKTIQVQVRRTKKVCIIVTRERQMMMTMLRRVRIKHLPKKQPAHFV
jgi:hypothetical protein